MEMRNFVLTGFQVEREVSPKKQREARAVGNLPTSSVRDVTLLMMVRYMPDEDFNSLCEQALSSGATARQDAAGRGEARQGDTTCMVCSEAFEPSPLTEAAQASCGVQACKPCIDHMLAAIFGPASANNVFHLAARRGRP